MRDVVPALALAMSGLPSGGSAQITRDTYYSMLPARPAIVGQTRASEAFRLFGDRSDPAYRDTAPVDGIDDVRGKRLLQLAEHFSPIIRPNNENLPRHPFDVLGRPTLHADRWENGERVASDSVVFGQGPTVKQAGTPSESSAVSSDRISLLRAIYRRMGPRVPRSSIASPELDSTEILFFDLPGSEPRAWRRHAKTTQSPPRIFAHPFIYEDDDATDDARYLLVIQFWYFFHFNNSANNHEGDWEHINVQVTTRARAGSPATSDGRRKGTMTRAEVERLLDPRFPLDSLLISAVEYHFHHWVMTLDYLNRRVVPAKNRDAHRHASASVWEDNDHVRDAIDRRLATAGGRLATHPFVFLGGNHKGPVELFDLVPSFTWSLRRNSQGSYPFPGTWQTVGAFGVTEQLHGHIVPPIHGDSTTPWHSRVADPHYMSFTARDILLLPDWERLEPLFETSDAALERWGWLVLPVHWGFPASQSIGAGALKHVDLGNLAPYSPTFKAQWNRVGLSADRQQYDPRILRTPVSPTTPWALVRSGWGILNIPLAAFGLMPGYNVVMHELTPWAGGTLHVLGLPPPRTFTAARLPHRFTSAGQGPVWEFGGKDLARLLPSDSAVMTRSAEPGVRFWIELFFHDRFALENTYSTNYSTLTRGEAKARLQQRQLTGGFRFMPTGLSAYDHSVRLYARAGYGWLSLRAYDMTDSAGAVPDKRDGQLPTLLPTATWWPNTWYAGGGLELFAPTRAWLFRRLGYGLRLESSAYHHRLPAKHGSPGGRVDVARQDFAASLIFGW